MPNQQHAVVLVGGCEHFLLDFCKPEIVGIEVISDRDQLYPPLQIREKGGANHLLTFLTAPGIAGVRRAAVTAQEDEKPISLG